MAEQVKREIDEILAELIAIGDESLLWVAEACAVAKEATKAQLKDTPDIDNIVDRSYLTTLKSILASARKQHAHQNRP